MMFRKRMFPVSRSEIVERAIKAIGNSRPDEYILTPVSHVQELAHGAPRLAALLRHSAVETLAARYERLSEDARSAQERFEANVGQANLATLTLGLLGPAIMVAGILETQLTTLLMRPLLIGLGIFTVVCGSLAAMWTFRVRDGRLLDDWMMARSDAERTRLAYFESVLGLKDNSRSDPSAVSDHESREIPLGLLKLEYFRRYQLDAQISNPDHS
jgi:hypothetical protein